jgi:hypothetical protein
LRSQEDNAPVGPGSPSSDPVQTEARVVTLLDRSAIQATIRSLFISTRVPHPPGTTRTSRSGQPSRSWSATTFRPPVATTTPGCSATRMTS